MAANKKKGVLTGPDPDDAIVHEWFRKDYPKMSKEDKARFDKADAAMKKTGATRSTKKPASKKK